MLLSATCFVLIMRPLQGHGVFYHSDRGKPLSYIMSSLRDCASMFTPVMGEAFNYAVII